MTGRHLLRRRGCVLAAGLVLGGQTAPLDVILVNGQIITVDERFTMAQAVGVRGARIAAVGTNEEVTRWRARPTRRIDLGGKAVIPGLIDNHMHLLRAGTTWQREVRLDGVGSRAARARPAAGARDRDAAGRVDLHAGRLDAGAVRRRSAAVHARGARSRRAGPSAAAAGVVLPRRTLNSRALEALGVTGSPTGQIDEAGIRALAARLPTASGEALERSTRAMIRDLNQAGLTAFGSAGCEADVLPLYRQLADRQQLDVRVFCITGAAASSPAQVDRALPLIRAMKVGQGDDVHRSDRLRRERLRPAARSDVRQGVDARRRRSRRSGAGWRPRSRRRACRCTCTPT